MVWIFKTDVNSEINMYQLKPFIEGLDKRLKWSLDTEDCDNVLRIESERDIRSQVIAILNTNGFFCAELD